MKILELQSGKYVLALSGGVDSMVLLDILAAKNKIELTLAHFNHGIRPDSHKDEELVRQTAQKNKFKLEIGYGNLGQNASEDSARQKRYDFLRDVAKKHGATGIITAHHQDDLIETAFLNMLRGTGYRGLTAILLNQNIRRPLINIPKCEIINYAKNRNLVWIEDSSNQDIKYLRNYVRIYLVPKLNANDRQKMIQIIQNIAKKQTEIEELLAAFSKNNESRVVDRAQFINMPGQIGNELIMYWLRQNGQTQYDKKAVDRLNMALKTAKSGTKHVVNNNIWLKIDKKTAQLTKTS